MAVVSRARASVSRAMARMVNTRTMATVRFTQDHEWLSIDGDLVTVGITEYAQDQMGDVVHVTLREVDDSVAQGDSIASVESVKAASDVYCPFDGVVVEVNTALEDDPGLVNQSPEEQGWFAKLKVSEAVDESAMMDEASYRAYCEAEH